MEVALTVGIFIEIIDGNEVNLFFRRSSYCRVSLCTERATMVHIGCEEESSPGSANYREWES